MEKTEKKRIAVSNPSPPKPEPEPAISSPADEKEEKEELKTLPKIRLKVEEETEKVKKFATAKGLSTYIHVSKAKRAGLVTLHKVATWLSPKNK